MAVNFPNTPSLNEEFSAGDRTWLWNGTYWEAISTTIGYTGSAGAGYTGSQGDIGYTGSAGQDGTIGADGSQGDIGYTGSQGDIGYTGSQGDIGYTGSQGDIGYTGFVGSQGEIGFTGFVGSQGEIGFTGSQGDVGFTGSKGDLGYVGSQGVQGVAGTSVTIIGSLPSSASLDPGYTGNVGDGYIIEDTGHLWVWSGTSWSDVGQIQGETGYTGSQGADGLIGGDGYTGSQGGIGYTGSTGESSFTYGPDAPLNPTVGDRWYDSIDGAELVYTNDGNSTQWVEVAASGFLGQTGYIGSSGASGGPKITNIDITDSSYALVDDTAVSIDGGYIKITGSAFESGCQILINNIPATSTTFISATEVRAQIPAADAGTYIVYLVNTDGGVAIRVNGITYSGTPTWITGSSLPTSDLSSEISIQLSADGALTYSLAAGSTLPPGLTLSGAGLLSGTITAPLESATVYNFTVAAIDAELQDSPRSFSITITAGDTLFTYVTSLISPVLATVPFNADASTNNFAVSIAGDTKPNNFSPYTSGYYSNYFDGTGDYLTIPASNDFVFDDGDFTIEAWIYPRTTGTELGIVNNWQIGGAFIFRLLSSNKLQLTYRISSGSINKTATDIVSANKWTHVAVVRNNNNIYFYINGIADSGGALSSNETIIYYNNAPKDLKIGTSGDTGNLWNGYISNLRIVKGVAVYTSAFTPPTEPLATIASTSLLTCQSNRLIDNSTNNFAITKIGDTKIDGFNPFVPAAEFAGRGSTYFDGTGDSLSAASNTAFAMYSGTFTFECFLYINALPGSVAGIFDTGSSVNPNRLSVVLYSSGKIYLDSNANLLISDAILSVGQWYHIAIVREGTGSDQTKLYVNGVLNKSSTVSTDFSNSNCKIGQTIDNLGLNGYLSNLRLVKGSAVYTADFTPPTQPLTAIENTSLLTCQSNQPANNNVFIDNSTKNALITRNGNTNQGTFSPYGDNWSNYFDGSGDYLATPSSEDFNIATTNSTVECWFYATALPASLKALVASFNSGSGGSFFLGIDSSNRISIRTGNDASVVGGTTTLLPNIWYHVALIRDGAISAKVYLNGNLEISSTSFSWTSSTQPCYIGTYAGNGPFTGYIAGARVVKGAVVYTAAFAPPTEPLTAISGTSLLTCQSNRFIDNSTNNFTITRNGDTKAVPFSPYRPSEQYDPTVHGGSAYFDDVGDYLTIPNSEGFQFGTGDFTIEFWINRNNADGSIISINQSAGAGAWAAVISGGSLYFQSSVAGTSLLYPFAIRVGVWTHCAWTREGGVNRAFINGVKVQEVTNSTNYTNTNNLLVGTAPSTYGDYAGYIGDVRVVKGTAVYTSDFVPPVAPLTPIQNTTLLINGTSAAIYDSSMNNNLETVGDAKLSTAVVKYGNTSMSFDGTTDYIVNPTSINFGYGTGDFTIEFWVYFNTVSSDRTIVSNLTSAASVNPHLYLLGSGSTIRYFTNSADRIVGPVVSINTWYHIAVSRAAGSTRLFVNGTQTGSTYADSNNYGTSAPLGVGTYHDGAVPHTISTFNGYISDLRITKGVARYNENFTPPGTLFQKQ